MNIIPKIGQSYDVVNELGAYLCFGSIQSIEGDSVELRRMGPFGSGYATFNISQLRDPFSVIRSKDNMYSPRMKSV
jgi:hypothetical protein